jgi:DNA-binding CsgD family transcriptional regulator
VSAAVSVALSEREVELLRHVANGGTYVQLAERWVLAEVSVRSIGHGMLRKLGASTIAHAVYLACQTGVLDGRPRRHGDHSGYSAHLLRGEVPCEACRLGERVYRNAQRAARRNRVQDGRARPPDVREDANASPSAPDQNNDSKEGQFHATANPR